MEKRKISLIGCGAIGSSLAEYIKRDLIEYVSDLMFYDIDISRSSRLSDRIGGAYIASDIREAVVKGDIIVEACSGEVVPEIFRHILDNRKDLMIMSVGGILGRERLLAEAMEKGLKVILPSGAVAGIDGIKAAGIAGITSVTLTTRKSPASLKGAPYIVENGIDLDSVKEETVIFQGSAGEAVKGFPRNVNVSAILSIAGIGADKTEVRIVTSLGYTANVHEIKVESEAGRFLFRTENVPFPSNPKTSYLAALSAMAALESYFTSVRIGT